MVLGAVLLLGIAFGDQIIRAYFWAIVHFGEIMFQFLQWSGICSQ